MIPENSPAAQESRCADMAQFYVLKRKQICNDCVPVKKKDWLGREREVPLKPEQKIARSVVHARRDDWAKEEKEQQRRIAAKQNG